MRMRSLLAAALALAACHSSSGNYADYYGKCVTPRVNVVDPNSGKPYADKQGSLDDEKNFLRLWSEDLYLWYRELPNDDGSSYSTPEAYFSILKTTAKTQTGHEKDRFHFTYPTDVWNALAGSGVEAGYGMQVVLLAASPPRDVRVSYIEPSSPAADAGIDRGTQILTIDGAAVLDGPPNVLNAGLFPATVGETHTFEVKDLGQTSSRTVTLKSAEVTNVPVQKVSTIDTPTGKVGYFLFNDNLSQAEKGLFDAVTTLKADGISDLVVDMRYNGGGLVDVAAQLGFMIAGPGPTTGKIFEKPTFNDKHDPNIDPVLQSPIVPTPFYTQAVGFSETPGAALPHLDLPRVYVLTSNNTCSASESVINGLRGVGIQVYAFGLTTCGKPYAFYPQDNCGTTYFSIEIKGVNAQGFGDYPDGFVPGSNTDTGLPGCIVADDFSHALGDPAEGQLAAALAYRANGTCATGARRADDRSIASPVLPKNFWRTNKWYR